MKEELQAVATIMALVNPAMCVAIFSRIAGDRPRNVRIKEAFTSVFIIVVVLMIAALFGTTILKLFGVSLSAFSCAGGGILVWIGVNMLSARQTGEAGVGDGAEGGITSLMPLILFGASPGTITGVITVSASHSRFAIPVTAIIAIAVTCLILLAVLLFAARTDGKNGSKSIASRMLTSYMGVIVIAMGIQFALTGYRDFMAAG
ncbi:MAG: MarC family protein [Candidatus Aegiribacteria sp.]